MHPLPSVVLTVFYSSSVWPSNAGVVSNTAIARMHHAKGNFPLMKSPLSTLHWATRKLLSMSICSSSRLSTDYAGVLGTGVKRLMISSVPLVSNLFHVSLVSTPNLFVILGILWHHVPPSRCPWACMSTTLYISLRIRPSKHFLNAFSKNLLMLLHGFDIFCGVSPSPTWQSI
jgi:hypothetical protein